MLNSLIIIFILASSSPLDNESIGYQKTVDELFSGKGELVYRISEFPPGMKGIFDRYINKMDPLKGGVVEFGEPFSIGDIHTEEPKLRLVFAVVSNNAGAVLVQHSEGFGGHINIVFFDITQSWYCYADLGSDLTHIDVLKIGEVLRNRFKKGESPACEKW